MSLAGVRFVFEHAPRHKIQGSELVVLLYVAAKAEQRSPPFITEASQKELAHAASFSDTRRIRRIMDELIAKDFIRILKQGTGINPSIYAVGHACRKWWDEYLTGRVCGPALEGVRRPAPSCDPSEENGSEPYVAEFPHAGFSVNGDVSPALDSDDPPPF